MNVKRFDSERCVHRYKSEKRFALYEDDILLPCNYQIKAQIKGGLIRHFKIRNLRQAKYISM